MSTKTKKDLKIAKGGKIPKDLFEYKGKLYQKVDDDGIPNQLYLKLKQRGLA